MIEYYINELLSEGITFVPVWKDSSEKSNALVKQTSADGSSHRLAEETSVSSAPAETPPSPVSSRQRSESTSSRSSLMLGASAANITQVGALACSEAEGKSPINDNLQ